MILILKISKLVNLKGIHDFRLTSNGGRGIIFDGFILVESNIADKIEFIQKEWNPVPNIIEGPVKIQ
ncbi:MAG: hypothetical protein H6613_02955 [Ignavibacteriales bacterium]|nr:hypothetical protein [Ignavibacteriales bacterium]